MISSFLGYNKHFEAMYLGGEIELEFCPQGTLAEKIRSAGAGVGGFYTKTGVDTLVETGGVIIKYVQGTTKPEILSPPKPTMQIRGKKYVFEESIFGDFAFIKAQKADRAGNLVFNKTSRNFNQDMAKAAKHVVAEVEEIVEIG
jgi:3-oxoacid CoA-transferase